MYNNDRKVELGDIAKAIYESKILIVVTTLSFAIISVIIALSIPNQFESSVVLSPNDTETNDTLGGLSSQIGGLASLAGLSLSGKSVDSVQVAVAILNSRDFLVKFINEKNISVPLFATDSWDPKTDKLEINSDIYNSKNKTWTRDVEFPYRPEPSSEELYKEITERLTVEFLDNGLLQVSFEFYSPKLAAEWLSWLITDLNNEVRKREKEEAQKSISFLQREINQTDLAEVKTVLYQLIEEQTKKLMFAEVREEFSFKIIDSAFVPEKKSFPNRPLICILITLIGFIFSCALSLLIFASKRSRENG